MRTANLASQCLRHAESGLVWEEKLSNATGAIEVLPHATFRVRATAGTTVTIDGVLAMTMMANEIAIMNAGGGNPDDTKATVTVTIATAAAWVQVARDVDRPKTPTSI
jgi:hypothetical protein